MFHRVADATSDVPWDKKRFRAGDVAAGGSSLGTLIYRDFFSNSVIFFSEVIPLFREYLLSMVYSPRCIRSTEDIYGLVSNVGSPSNHRAAPVTQFISLLVAHHTLLRGPYGKPSSHL